MSNRTNAWSRIGTDVSSEAIVERAIKRAQMDWKVEQVPVTILGKIYDKQVANIRSDNKTILGIVGKDYNVIHNEEVFSMANDLVNQGRAKLEKVGELDEGRKVWLIMKLLEQELLGDKISQYMILQSSHDGSIKLRGCIAPLRTICQNQINISFKESKIQWGIMHTTSAQERIKEVEKSIENATSYIDVFNKKAEIMAAKKVSDESFWRIMKELYPVTSNDSDKKRDRIEGIISDIRDIYVNGKDLQNFKGTGWGLINAISDINTHQEPVRKCEKWEEKVFEKLVNSNNIIDKAYDLVMAA